MTIPELRKSFIVFDKLPSSKEFLKNKYTSVISIKEGGKSYYIIFRNLREVRLYSYLQSTKDCKAKEELFGIDIDKGYAYVADGNSAPSYLQLVLPKKWVIEDSKIKRELEVVVTDINQENDQLLHELYSKTRDKK